MEYPEATGVGRSGSHKEITDTCSVDGSKMI